MSRFENYDSDNESSMPLDEEMLLIVDWQIQAEGCALMYAQTRDTDYVRMQIEAEQKASRQQKLLAKRALQPKI